MLTPDEQHVFEQLGRNLAFKDWLKKEEATRISVLKKNTSIEQLCQAQGACQLLDQIKGFCGIK